MAKLIRMGEDDWKKLAEDMVEDMKKRKVYNGNFQYEVKMPSVERTAKIVFTLPAFTKMMALLMVFDKEVGWYCTCRRSEEENDEYIVDDVLVFPQTVTSVTVDSDDEKRTAWFDSLPVETLLSIKCDCHSHVNMSTSPSGTDDKDMRAVFDNIPQDGFRIFMIWNKSLEYWAAIYDVQKNVIFESDEIEVEVLGVDLNTFIKDAKGLVQNRVYSTYQYNKTKTTPKTTSTTKGKPATTKSKAKSVPVAKTTSPVNKKDETEIDYDQLEEDAWLEELRERFGFDDDVEDVDDEYHEYGYRDKRGYHKGNYYGYGY